MLAQAQLVGFVLTVDAERARRFYVDTLGLTFVSDDPFAITVRSNGTELRIVRIKAFSPSEHTVLGWEVSDIATTAKQFIAAGITFERYPFIEQDTDGIWNAPDGRTKLGWFKDPDGNVLSIAQH